LPQTAALDGPTAATHWRLGDLALADLAAVGDTDVFGFGVTPAGEILLWSGAAPVAELGALALLVPRARLLALCPRLAETDHVPGLQHSPGARLLVRYLDALAAELPVLTESEAASAGEAALELLRAAIEPSMPETRDARRAAIRADVRRYIRRHLRDDDLSPESIARAHAVSVRTLHALFEDSEESVARLVRRERLARCLEDLRRPTGGSVTEIAFRWGFRDAAHFARVFKREYGQSPSDARAAA
jgi:AraC family transcriptional regulator, positive regulator of tynA and feaB